MVFNMDSLARDAADGTNLFHQSYLKINIWQQVFFSPGLGWRYSEVLEITSTTALLVTSTFYKTQQTHTSQVYNTTNMKQ